VSRQITQIGLQISSTIGTAIEWNVVICNITAIIEDLNLQKEKKEIQSNRGRTDDHQQKESLLFEN
jgi:hypothetical protein